MRCPLPSLYCRALRCETKCRCKESQQSQVDIRLFMTEIYSAAVCIECVLTTARTSSRTVLPWHNSRLLRAL